MSTPEAPERSAQPNDQAAGLALVQCTDVSRTYGSGAQAMVAVHGATCEILPGARVAMTGASGSGKSTILHLLAGLDEPTSGTVTWPALGARGLHRPGLISVVFQGPSLLPPLDVLENVALPLVLAGHRPDEATRTARAALDALAIPELSSKIPDELSGGQAQRVAVARVLASAPRLILADEPTGQLDHATGHHVISVLLRAADELGAALVVATHDPEIGERLSSRWRVRDGALDTGRSTARSPDVR